MDFWEDEAKVISDYDANIWDVLIHGVHIN